MRQWLRSHLTYANVMVTILAFIVLTGGTAVALNGSNTVQSDDLGPGSQVKAPDVDANAVNGSDVLNGSLSLSDLNGISRPHKLEFSVPNGTTQTTIANVGNLRVSGQCTTIFTGATALYIRLKNLTTQTGTMNALLTDQAASNGAVTLRTAGQFVGPGAEITLDYLDGEEGRALASGAFNRVEGQVVFQTPGRVTTIDFHAFATGPSGRCEFYGTAVTSNLS